MTHRAGTGSPRRAGRPRIVLVVGSRPRVGATSIAVNLAAAMRYHGVHGLLIDADARGGNIAGPTPPDKTPSLADVLNGRRRLQEVIRRGPGGIDLVPGIWGMERLSDHPAAACRPLIEQLAKFGGQADWVLIDGGLADSPPARRLHASVDALLVVTTDDASAVLDSYAAIKSFCRATSTTAVLALFNRVSSEPRSSDAARRLGTACRRLLGFDLTVLATVADDPRMSRPSAGGGALVTDEPGANAARALIHAARSLVEAPRIRRPVAPPPVRIIGPFRATVEGPIEHRSQPRTLNRKNRRN